MSTTHVKGAVRKDDTKVTFNFSNGQLGPNGDYDLVHKYDPEMLGRHTKQQKLNQAIMWVNHTFPCECPPSSNVDPINRFARIFQQVDNLEDLIEALNWLNDPKDN